VIDRDQRMRMDGIGDGPFDPTAEGIRALAASDRRKPWTDDEIATFAYELWRDGGMAAAEVEKLGVQC
jgi:hypothetical protein